MKKYIPALLTLVLLIVIYFVSRNISQTQVDEFLRNTGILAPLVFIFLSLLTYIIAPLSGSPLLFVGYKLFDITVIYLMTVAAFLSFIINFWLARKYGQPLIEKLIGKKSMETVNALVSDYGLVALFFLRVFQGGLHDFISFAAGLSSMKFGQYLIVSTLALIPSTALWYFLAIKTQSPANFTIVSFIVSFVMSGVFIIGKKLLIILKK